MTFKDYVLSGDKVTLAFNLATKKLRSFNVDTWLDDPKDAVTLKTSFSSLPDGANFLEQSLFDATAQSAGDILRNLQFGVMGRTRVTYKRWFVGFDGVYMGLGAMNDLVNAGVDQLLLEPSAGYKLKPYLEVLGGARYNSFAVDLKFGGR